MIEVNLDEGLRTQALSEASDIYDKIRQAMEDPVVSIAGEPKKIYEELIAWNMFDDLPFNENRGTYIKMFAMTRYRHLRWAKEHPAKSGKKKSKWERVMGGRLNKR